MLLVPPVSWVLKNDRGAFYRREMCRELFYVGCIGRHHEEIVLRGSGGFELPQIEPTKSAVKLVTHGGLAIQTFVTKVDPSFCTSLRA